jgi:hypothetical protein
MMSGLVQQREDKAIVLDLRVKRQATENIHASLAI